MWFRTIYVLFGCEQKFWYFPLFFAKIREIPYSRNAKLQSAITPVLQKIEPCSLRTAGGFRKRRIEWFDRHLCHVTGSDDAHRFGVKKAPWPRVDQRWWLTSCNCRYNGRVSSASLLRHKGKILIFSTIFHKNAWILTEPCSLRIAEGFRQWQWTENFNRPIFYYFSQKYAKLRYWCFVYSYESQHCTFSITSTDNILDSLQLHN